MCFSTRIHFSSVDSENYFKLLTADFETLFANSDDNNYDVRLAVEENITKLVKNMTKHAYSFKICNMYVRNLKETQLVRVQVELYRIMKRNSNVEPGALKDE